MEQLLAELKEGSLTYEDVAQSKTLIELRDRINIWKETLKDNRTAQLWFLYLKLITLLKDHRNFERTGQFEAQLVTLNKMRPCLAATGHHQYAKAITLYLNDMMLLKKNQPDVWQELVKCPVVRQSNDSWAGIHLDLAIEKVLMRSLKSLGGLSHGRGWDEMQQLIFLLSRPACAEYHHSLQNLLSSKPKTATRHAWSAPARMKRDTADVKKLSAFFDTYDPFSSDNKTLRSITTGMEAHPSTNVDRAEEIGQKILEAMNNQEVDHYTFPNSLKVKTLALRLPVNVGEKTVDVDPMLLFQRLSVSASTKSEDQKREAFSLELCSYPPNLFDKNLLMRTGNYINFTNYQYSLLSYHTENFLINSTF